MAYRRGNYYYRSLRQDGRVVTDYLGSDDTGRALADLDALDQLRRRLEHLEDRERKEFEASLDQCVDAVDHLIRALSDAVLLSDGYHTHRGQWRRTRS